MIGMNFTTDSGWPDEVTHVRLWDIGVAWKDIHVGPKTFDWTRLDRLMDYAAGRHVTYVIGATPRWLAKDPNSPHAAAWLGPGSNSMPWSLMHAGDFFTAIASRYRGRIHAYEVWNEPQLVDFLYPWTAATRSNLAELTVLAAKRIHRADMHALVLAGAILPRPSSGGITRASRYLSALAVKGWPVDGFTTHIYPEHGKGVDRWTWMLAQARQAIVGAPTQRLWITETNFDVPGGSIPDAATPPLINGAVKAAGKSALWWYAWQRPDLGGILIDRDTQAWNAIRSHR